MQAYWVALDLGTSSLKIVCSDPDGKVLHTATQACHTYHPQPGWEEQHPEALLEGVQILLTDAVTRLGQPQAISLSAAMHSLMAVDEQGMPQSELLIWSDLRSSQEAKWLKQRIGEKVYAHSGVPIHPMLPLCKLVYWKNNLPAWFQQVAWFISLKEYILFHLTGQIKVDYAMAGATGMFNMLERDWDKEVLQLIDLDPSRLPEISSPLQACFTHGGQRLTRASGLASGIPVLVGATDGCLAALGSGIEGSQHLSVTVGTSAAVRLWSHRPVWDHQQRLFCYMLFPEAYVVGAALNNGGGIIPRCMEMMDDRESDVEAWIAKAMQAPPGSDGLMCLPYLYGERSPVWDPEASGAFLGLRAHHQACHVHRAILEGIGFCLMQALRILETAVHLPDQKAKSGDIILSGGITHSQPWMQLLANMLGRKLVVRQQVDASCAGALQLLARYFHRKPLEITRASAMEEEKLILPDAQAALQYAALLPKFEALYPLVKSWQEIATTKPRK